MTKLSLVAIAALVPAASTAFSPSANTRSIAAAFAPSHNQAALVSLNAETEKGTAADAVFVPDEPASGDKDISLEAAESLGKGAAKAKRGKRKGASAEAKKAAKVAASLSPEEVYYEGPPAITETIVPTISILTVVGIIPAAAAWARQAWVRYKITTRRVRVTSGIGGKDMSEIVYPDIVEIRTAKRLFGDGDMVAFLRDGAKFEMRNIPNFEDTMDFILKQVDPEVAKTYRQEGDVTNP